jgi:hypothetical protein
VLLEDQTILYGFEQEPDMWLMSGSLGDGSPIQGIFVPSRQVLVNLGHEAWGVGAPQVRKAMEILSALPVEAARPDGSYQTPRVVLVTGDFSFAHHVWNQLGALDHAVAADGLGDRPLDVLALREPLGPVAELFDDCRSWSVNYCHPSRVQQLNRAGMLFVPLGGWLVTRGARERVFRWIDRQEGRRRPPAKHGVRFWLSVRTRNRTVENQVEFLAALANALIARFGGCEIVLDGHSLSEDEERQFELGDRSALAIVAADRQVIDAVVERLDLRGAIVIESVGCRIGEAIDLARSCDFYVCHHGTVQHKIGWFVEVPGVVHCNRQVTLSRPAEFVAMQVEGAVVPTYLPEHFIDDMKRDVAGGAVQESLQHGNYTITDVAGACEFVLAEIEQLGLAASHRGWRGFQRRWQRRLGLLPRRESVMSMTP